MTVQSSPEFTTDPFFGLDDQWIQTAPGEITHYHDLGKGLPLLFLHGSGSGVSAAANWWLNVPDLSQEFRTIAIDLVGFGQTRESAQTPFGMKGWTAHVLRVLNALNIEKIWLVGNSLGGWVSFQFALDYPERVAGIISMGTGGAPRTKALKSHAKPELSPDGIRQALLDFVVDQSLVEDELVQARFAAAIRPEAAERFKRVIEARDYDREHLPLDLEALSKFTGPVLLIHGREDRVIPLKRSYDLLEVLPNADLHVFSQCGHWSQVERAGEFNKVIASYLHAHAGNLSAS